MNEDPLSVIVQADRTKAIALLLAEQFTGEAGPTLSNKMIEAALYQIVDNMSVIQDEA